MEHLSYHHGNLKMALIEAGIELFNEVGYENLSLRKVAARCNVTHAAPYGHFKSKEELIEAMKEYASIRFAEALEHSVDPYRSEDIGVQVEQMAKAYVSFFIQNPRYYSFIFEQADFDINLDDLSSVNGFRAFEVFRRLAVTYAQSLGIPEQGIRHHVIHMWALVHGIAGIAIMNGITFSGDWLSIIGGIISGNREANREESK